MSKQGGPAGPCQITVKLMSNRPETACQNHDSPGVPLSKLSLLPGPGFIPHEIFRKNAKKFAPAAGFLTSGSAANTRQGRLQIYTAPLT